MIVYGAYSADATIIAVYLHRNIGEALKGVSFIIKTQNENYLPYGFDLTKESGKIRLEKLKQYTDSKTIKGIENKKIRVIFIMNDNDFCLQVIGFGHPNEDKFISDFNFNNDDVKEVSRDELIELFNNEMM